MIIKTRSLTESLENKYKLDESPNSDYDLEDELDDLYDEEESDDKEFNDKLDTILNKYKFESLNGPLNESFVEEWWGQTEDNPRDLKQYGLKVEPLKRKNDETLYRFSGSLEDINKARKDGYFYSLEVGEDENHSEDLNEALTEAKDDKNIEWFVGGNESGYMYKHEQAALNALKDYIEIAKNTEGCEIISIQVIPQDGWGNNL